MVRKTSKNIIAKANPGTVPSFWSSLPKPFFVLAPMANVTDSVFRKLIAKYGKPDVTWTEFVSADGLISPGKENLLHDLVYSEKERPIVAQLFTGHPEAMKKAAQLVKDLGFDGLDINMGCPAREVEKQGGGAAMIRTVENAVAVLNAAREGAGPKMSVSVKTRIGYNSVDLEWLRILLGQKLPALTVHLRTRKEMSDVPAHWELMPDIIKLRDQISPETLIIGNGDVLSRAEGVEKIQKYGGDGVMIGRGIFGTPWLFESASRPNKGRRSRKDITSAVATAGNDVLSTVRSKAEDTKREPSLPRGRDGQDVSRSPAERLAIMVEHAKLFEKTFTGIKNFAVMKKHFKAYVSGWDGAKELRVKLMETSTAKEVTKIVKDYLAENRG